MMAQLTNQLRKAIINILQDGAGYRDQLDLSQFLRTGITAEEIGLLEFVSDSLHRAPFLENEDFLKKGISQFQIDRILGGINNIKQIMKLDEYCFTDWLRDQDYKQQDGLCLPYWIFLRFAADIRRDFMSGISLSSNLTVQLNDDYQVQQIHLCDGLDTKIPVNQYEAAIAASGFFYYTHEFESYDRERSIITLRSLKTEREWQCEIRCFSSQFSQRTKHAICVLDDEHQTKINGHKRRVATFQ